jgi:hypothetical protein
MIDEVVGIAPGIARGAVSLGQARELEAGTEFDQHVLERTDIALRRHHRLADRIGDPLGIADRSVE